MVGWLVINASHLLPPSHTLCDLARVCAEVCCNVDPLVNKELMGAFRALCLPMTMMKSCMTGYSHLTSKSNVSCVIFKHFCVNAPYFIQILMDPGIQSKLISFAGLLVANDCFFLHDIIAYIIQPIIKVQMTHPHGRCYIYRKCTCFGYLDLYIQWNLYTTVLVCDTLAQLAESCLGNLLGKS